MAQPRDYRKFTSYKNILQMRRLDLIVDQVRNFTQGKDASKVRVLELGCGIGAISFPLSSFGFKMVGMDIDDASIKSCTAENPFPDTSTYMVGDAETFDLKETFDIVIATEVMEHCPHPERVLETLKRHLSPGGIGIVSVPNGYCVNEIVFGQLFQKIGLHTLFHKLPKKVYTALTGSPTPYYSKNVFCNHVQFFTYGRFNNLLGRGNFVAASALNLDLGLVLDWKWLSPLKRVEFKLARFAPHSMAGGWVLLIKPEGQLGAR